MYTYIIKLLNAPPRVSSHNVRTTSFLKYTTLVSSLVPQN
jgi:hypothetical protein